MRLLVLSFSSILVAPILVGALFTTLGLWVEATLYRRLEKFFPFFFWPLLITNGLLYLFRVAGNSFGLHGRRPSSVLFGGFQFGELYEGKHGHYDDDQILRTHRMPLYYDWWVGLTNPVLFDAWIHEQNIGLFFRGGSFVRYLFLLVYFFALTLGQQLTRLLLTFLGSELGHSILLLFFGILNNCLRWLSRPIGGISRLYVRFPYALAGEYHLLLAFRYFRLEPFLRFQGYQDDNVEAGDWPETVYRRPPGLLFLRSLWYGNSRYDSERSYRGPTFFSFGNLVALALSAIFLLPFGLLSALVLGTALFYRLSLSQYGLCRRLFSGFFRPCGLFAESFCLAFPGMVFSTLFIMGHAAGKFPGALLFTLATVCRRLGQSLAFIVLACLFLLLAAFDFQPLLHFGLGYIFIEFFDQFSAFLFPLTSMPYDRFPLGQNFDLETLYEFKSDGYDELIYLRGFSYHGSGVKGFPVRKTPLTQLRGFTRAKCHWWWNHPVGEVAARPPYLELLGSIHFSIHDRFYEANLGEDEMAELSKEWWTMLEDWDNIKELMGRIPFDGLRYAFLARYYSFMKRLIYQSSFFYWFCLAARYKFYAFCLFLTAFIDLLIKAPIRQALYIAQLVCFFSRPASYVLSNFSVLSTAILSAMVGFSGSSKTYLFDFFSARLHPLLSAAGTILQQTLATPVFFARPLWSTMTPTGLFYYTYVDAVKTLWHHTAGWLLWYFSVVFDELFLKSFGDDFLPLYTSPAFGSVLSRYEQLFSLTFGWPPLSALDDRGESLWTLALAAYMQAQIFGDNLFVSLQLPRDLDNFTLSYRQRRPRRTLVYDSTYTTVIKGAFSTGRRWALSPVILFRCGSSFERSVDRFMPDQYWVLGELAPVTGLPSAFSASFPPEDIQVMEPYHSAMIATLRYFPFSLADAYRVFLTLLPLLYFIALLLLIALFPGATALLFDLSEKPQPYSTIFNRQWGWNGCRFEQPAASFEGLFYRKPTVLLLSTQLPLLPALAPHSKKLFRRFYERYLDTQGGPSLPFMDAVRQNHCLGAGLGYRLHQADSPNAVIPAFGDYLLSPKYDYLRLNLLDHGTQFLIFIAYFYSKNPWVPLCGNQYDDEDYPTWLPDANRDFAERAIVSGKILRHRLEAADRFLFNGRLSAWVWSKDVGTFEFQKVASPETWAAMAYEVDEKDYDAYIPGGPLFWFLAFPLYYYSNLYLHLEYPGTDQPLFGGAGTQELRKTLLGDHNILGHFWFFHQQHEMRGWDHIPDWQKPDAATTPGEDIPVNGYPGTGTHGYAGAFYHTPIRWYYESPKWVGFVGTGQPVGLLEEYALGRFFLFLFLIFIFPWLLRHSSVLSPFVPSLGPLRDQRDHFRSLRQHLNSAKQFFLGFGK